MDESNEFCPYYDGEDDKNCSKCPINLTCDVVEAEMVKEMEEEIRY